MVLNLAGLGAVRSGAYIEIGVRLWQIEFFKENLGHLETGDLRPETGDWRLET
jgi:hypothetical protein